MLLSSMRGMGSTLPNSKNGSALGTARASTPAGLTNDDNFPQIKAPIAVGGLTESHNHGSGR